MEIKQYDLIYFKKDANSLKGTPCIVISVPVKSVKDGYNPSSYFTLLPVSSNISYLDSDMSVTSSVYPLQDSGPFNTFIPVINGIFSAREMAVNNSDCVGSLGETDRTRIVRLLCAYFSIKNDDISNDKAEVEALKYHVATLIEENTSLKSRISEMESSEYIEEEEDPQCINDGLFYKKLYYELIDRLVMKGR